MGEGDESGIETGRERVVCRACGTESEHDFLRSAREDGPPDLDTRPAAPMRAALRYWVQRCPQCQYCAPSLAEGPYLAARVVKTRAYQDLLADGARPALANAFLASCAVLDAASLHGEAGWQAVYAAWACDDAGDAESARACRSRAVECFDAARAAGQAYGDARAAEDAIAADLLRRAGRFDDAVARATGALAGADQPDTLSRAVLLFERVRAAAEDDGVYTVTEAQSARVAEA